MCRCACLVFAAVPVLAAAIDYPDTRTVDQVDIYHGVEIADPYRWLEADVRESEAVADWVEVQNAVSRRYLAALPMRETFFERLREHWNYERFGLPVERGGRYFFTRNAGLQDQSVLYVQDGPDAEPRVLIDPNTWSEDGTVSLAQWVVGPDGKHVAYGIQDGGSDWRTWRVREVATGEDSEHELEWLTFTSVSWHRDGSGFFYSRYPEPAEDEKFRSLNMNQKVYFHRLGQDQSEDRLVYARPDHPEWGFSAQVTHGGGYLVITIWKGTDSRCRIAWLDLASDTAEPVMLIEGFDHDYTFVGNDGPLFFFRTNRDAPRNRLVGININQPAPDNWLEILPEREHVLQDVSHVGGGFVAAYLEDAKSAVHVLDRDGDRIRRVELPGIGAVSGFDGQPDDPETFFAFESWNRPATLYRYDVASGQRSVWKSADVDFDPEDYRVRQVFYDSADGTRVPMFITHHKDVEPDSQAPTLLYGYGGFNIPLTPRFSVRNLAWMEAGGVFAVANLRGGGEYGRAWHKAGTKTDKQNVFDDFIAAAEYLIESGYTSRSNLGIYGRSNGGLLVGAVTNQRPDLFAAALPAAGVMDMLRFDQFTAGRVWVDDYGSPDNEDEFRALHAYSPYHNIRPGVDYPAVLVTAADRVVPGHSFKYAARLQAAQAGEAPVLIRIEGRSGHGSGTPVSKQIDNYADMWAFLAEHTGMGEDDRPGAESR